MGATLKVKRKLWTVKRLGPAFPIYVCNSAKAVLLQSFCSLCGIKGPVLAFPRGVCMFSSCLCGLSLGIQLPPTVQKHERCVDWRLRTDPEWERRL